MRLELGDCDLEIVVSSLIEMVKCLQEKVDHLQDILLEESDIDVNSLNKGD